MKKTTITLFFILFVIFTYAQDNSIESLQKQMYESIDKPNLALASQLMTNIQFREVIDTRDFAEYCCVITELSFRPEVSESDKEMIQELVLEFSQDSLFQTSYAKVFYQTKKYDTVQNYLDLLLVRYPNNRLTYLHQKGLNYYCQDRFGDVVSMYNEVLSADPNRVTALMEFGYFEMEHGTKIYEKNHNKEEVLPLFENGLINLRKGNNLLSSTERCSISILDVIKSFREMLLKEKIMTESQIDGYLEGVKLNECD